MRGVSEVVSALLMILIASSIGVALYLFFTTQFSIQVENYTRMISYSEETLNTRFRVTWVTYDDASGNLTLYIYNYGDTVIKIDSVYIDGVRYVVDPPREILVDRIEVVSIIVGLEEGPHRIRVVADNGVGYEFEYRV